MTTWTLRQSPHPRDRRLPPAVTGLAAPGRDALAAQMGGDRSSGAAEAAAT
jgi:hypothetical protein